MGLQRRIKRVDSNGISLGVAFKEFLMEKEAKNLSASTLQNYQQSYDYFKMFNGFTDNTSACEVTQEDFYKWIGALKSEGVRPASINHYLRDCRAFFYWCMDLDKQYIKPFKISVIKGQEEPIKCFKEKDIVALLVKPKNKDSFHVWRTWVIINWILGTGNRSSTVCSVKIGDIDYRYKEISLRHTKNRRTQIIPLSSSLEVALKEYVHIWRKNAQEDDWLFPNVGEEQLTTNALRHSFSRYCKSRGVEQTNIHGLRHTFGLDWIRNNGNMFALQKILGHQTLEMVRNYVRLSAEDIKKDFDQYSPLDNIGRTSRRTHIIKRNK